MWIDKTKAATQSTNAYVHRSAWQAIDVIALLGLASGYRLGRKT